jgi:xylitol oxidase
MGREDGAMRTNWAGSHRYRAATFARPTSLPEAQELVAASRRVRALGSGHSFTDLADTNGLLLSLEAVPGEVAIDASRATATVGGGLLLGQVAEALHREGWALAALPSLPHITVAGAIATGTHGSGNGVGSLASLVCGLEVIGADGELRSMTAEKPDFHGWVVSLGLLGVVTKVTLRIVPTFDVRQYVFTSLPWPVLREDFDDVMASAYSVSVFTDWAGDTVNQVWVKTTGTHQPPSLRSAVPAQAPMHMIPGMSPEAVTGQLGLEGAWHDRLPHFRMEFTPSSGEELQSEYLVPRPRAAEALAEVRRLAPHFVGMLQMGEIRTVAGDELWLSGAHGEDVAGLHFTWRRDWDRVHRILPILEDSLLPLGARPHWGKCFVATADSLRALYPRFDDFTALRRGVDPGGKFTNAFVDRVWGP